MSKPFTIAVLPDTQIYAESYPEIFDSQTRWIADNAERLNIAFVLHEGDVTNGNVEYHWRNAVHSMGLLDGAVPYAIVLGNHDMGPAGECDSRDSLFNDHFPVGRFEKLPTFGGVFESGRMDSSYHLFSAGGTDWLVLALEYLPRDSVLDWANDVAASHPERRFIVLTHSYVYSDNTLHGSSPDHAAGPGTDSLAAAPGGANDPVQIWGKLVRRHRNMTLAFSGHFVEPSPTARLVGTGDGGNRVYQMMANYQGMENGGNGYLRLVKCDPARATIGVETYSPHLDAYLTDPGNRFEFEGVDLGPPPR